MPKITTETMVIVRPTSVSYGMNFSEIYVITLITIIKYLLIVLASQNGSDN